MSAAMTDRELLEMAAKAAGITLANWNDGGEPYSSGPGFILPSNRIWNPLVNDGDALRLLVEIKGELAVWGGSSIHGPCTTLDHDDFSLIEQHNCDPWAATRRAIVRAAAEIGRAMP